jgi:ribose transport system substrate-binding protein
VSARAPHIAVFTKNRTNPAYHGARLGAERAGTALGARITHHVPQRPDDIDEQRALVDAVLADPPDGIVFVPVHETAVNDCIEKITAAGIPVANPIGRMTAGAPITFVGSDDEQLALAVARHLLAHIGGRGRVVLIEGIAASPTSAPRTRGFLAALDEYPQVQVVGRFAGDYQESIAHERMAAWLAPHADGRAPLDAVLSANDVMSLGAIEALAARGWPVPVIGINALPAAIAAVRAGTLLATVDFDAMKMTHLATEAVLRHLRGEAVPAQIMLPVQIVDRSNCAAWDRPLEQRECLRWDDVVTGRLPQ